MKTYMTKKIQQLHSFRHVQRLNESGAKRKKNTITLKLKQVCATHRQVHTGIAMVHTIIQSHIAAYLNRK